ncbi:GHKL domain-containing protein [Paludicola sp. MB14-C6]|uniref:sensor histidine kinase n=1 Tax=Paludihabitans sp. MB14-C6 TaxID=3070656 RepID=UPI0027DDDE0B|nr:sensor histidine kinase [Paludicola sp. MB14-C6]WMJ24457.1 GHKL domain-containing protein [Paludicola sp. MB14-C6]
MTQAFESLNYGLVLIYGVLLSVDFAGGYTNRKQKWLTGFIIVTVLLIQIVCGLVFGLTFTKKIYPFISHLPLILILIIGFKKKPGIAVVSVLTAYFCCQLPRWVASVAEFAFHTRMAFLLVYTVCIIIFYSVLRRYFTNSAHSAMAYSRRGLFLFGGLPLFYYLFDYVTTVYSDMLYQGIKMIAEFLPAAMALFYVLFIVMYHKEVQKRNQIELDNTMLSMQLEQASNDIQSAKASQEIARIYRHDLRHHLSLLYSFAESGNLEKIKNYLLQEQKELDETTPSIFCENNTANLVISSFHNKAKKVGVSFIVEAKLPIKLEIADTEFCSILSNGSENAINAASRIEDKSLRIIRVSCSMNRNKLLIMIQNAYTGEIQIKDDIPISTQEHHGFGCRSIVAIAKKRNGFAAFEAGGNIFTLRVVLPMGE